jgi:hypothetical protein
MDLIACPLCFYQRTLMMAVAVVLLAGIFGGARRAGFLSLVAMPLTVAGLGIAGMHVYKEYNGDLECPTGALCYFYAETQGFATCPEDIGEYDTAPRESLAVFILLFLFQTIDVLRSGRRGGFGPAAWLGVIILGGLFTFGLLETVKNHRDIPKAPKKPIEGCRKPLAPAGGPPPGK